MRIMWMVIHGSKKGKSRMVNKFWYLFGLAEFRCVIPGLLLHADFAMVIFILL